MNDKLQTLKEKLASSEKRLSNITLEKSKEESRIKELQELIKQEESNIITNFEIGDVFKYHDNSVLIIIPYGFQTTFETQLYWWVDKNLNPYSVLPQPQEKGMTKERMLKELNRLPNIRHFGNIKKVVSSSF